MAELDPIRLDGFTSTDMAAVHGLDPDRDLDALHAVKRRGVVMPPVPWRWELGKFLEPAVVDIFEHRTGHKVQRLFTKTFRHPKYPHIMATPDAMLLDENAGMDAKVCAFDQRHKFGPRPYDMPARINLQLVTLMEVMQVSHYYMALLVGHEYRTVRIDRDPEFGEWVVAEAARIWERYFEGDERPPIGGSEATSRWLRQTYPEHRADIRPATDAEIELLTAYGSVRAKLKALDRASVKLGNQLKAAVKDREGLEWPGGRFTWKRTKDSEWIDWESMAIALRTHYIRDADPQKQEAAREAVTKEHTRTTAGQRRIYYKSDIVSDVETEETADAA